MLRLVLFLLFISFLSFRWDVSIRVVGPQGDGRSSVFIFGESVDVAKAQDWIKSWIGPIDLVSDCNETMERESRRRPGARRGINRGEIDEGAWRFDRVLRSPVPPRGISGQYAASPSPQPPGDLRAKLDQQRKQNKEENVQDASKLSRGKSLAQSSKELDEGKSGLPLVGRDDGGMRRDRSRSTGRLMQEKTQRELRSKSSSRVIVEDRKKSERSRGRWASHVGRDLLRETSNLPGSHLGAERLGRITRSMSAARDLAGNGGERDACGKNQEGGRRNMTREERRDTMRQCGSSWRQLSGRGVEMQQRREEKSLRRTYSISTGRIPLEGQRSISSSRVGIGARRVRHITSSVANYPHLIRR